MWVGMIEIDGNSAKDEPQIPTTFVVLYFVKLSN